MLQPLNELKKVWKQMAETAGNKGQPGNPAAVEKRILQMVVCSL